MDLWKTTFLYNPTWFSGSMFIFLGGWITLEHPLEGLSTNECLFLAGRQKTDGSGLRHPKKQNSGSGGLSKAKRKLEGQQNKSSNFNIIILTQQTPSTIVNIYQPSPGITQHLHHYQNHFSPSSGHFTFITSCHQSPVHFQSATLNSAKGPNHKPGF